MNAPLQPLDSYERIGWLRNFNSLRCKKDCCPGSSGPGFAKGKDYALTVENVRLTHGGRKTRSGGVKESVTLSGNGLHRTATLYNGSVSFDTPMLWAIVGKFRIITSFRVYIHTFIALMALLCVTIAAAYIGR